MKRFIKLFQAFETLEILPTLDSDTINEAYRLLAQAYHPDKFSTVADKDIAHERFILISNAKDYILETIQKENVINAFDSTPLTIGYEQDNGFMHPIIRVGTIIPCSNVQIIHLTADTQGDFIIKLFQGIRPFAQDNIILAIVKLGFQNSNNNFKNSINVEARFSIDENGILSISDTIDVNSNKKLTVKIIGQQGLSDSEIDDHKVRALVNKVRDKEKANNIKYNNPG